MAIALFNHGAGSRALPVGRTGLLRGRAHAGPESFSVCSQGLRPGLIYAAPGGADVFAVVRLGTIEVWDGASPIHK